MRVGEVLYAYHCDGGKRWFEVLKETKCKVKVVRLKHWRLRILDAFGNRVDRRRCRRIRVQDPNSPCRKNRIDWLAFLDGSINTTVIPTRFL